jgi:hypothetical protein
MAKKKKPEVEGTAKATVEEATVVPPKVKNVTVKPMQKVTMNPEVQPVSYAAKDEKA